MDYQPRHAYPGGDAHLPHLIRGADTYAADDGVALAEHALADVYASLRSLSAVDPYDLDEVFAGARARIAAFRAASQASAQFSSQARKRPAARRGRDSRDSRDPSRHLRPGQGRREPVVRPAIPDVPGMELCPDPRDTRTPGEFLDCLRNYRIWAGKPSFRVMERRCDRRYAASTLCTALRARTMPTLEMVLTVVTVCGGGEEHQQEFATAWRRLAIGDPEAAADGDPAPAAASAGGLQQVAHQGREFAEVTRREAAALAHELDHHVVGAGVEVLADAGGSQGWGVRHNGVDQPLTAVTLEISVTKAELPQVLRVVRQPKVEAGVRAGLGQALVPRCQGDRQFGDEQRAGAEDLARERGVLGRREVRVRAEGRVAG